MLIIDIIIIEYYMYAVKYIEFEKCKNLLKKFENKTLRAW